MIEIFDPKENIVKKITRKNGKNIIRILEVVLRFSSPFIYFYFIRS